MSEETTGTEDNDARGEPGAGGEHPFQYPIVRTREDRVERLSFGKILRDLVRAFDLEHGFLFTLGRLYRRGGSAVRDYLGPERWRYTPPFRMLIITTAIAAFVLVRSPLFDQMLKGYEDALSSPSDETGRLLRLTIASTINVLIWLGIPVFSALSRLFVRGPFNYAEHLSLHAYLWAAWNPLMLLLIPLGAGGAENAFLPLAMVILVVSYFLFIRGFTRLSGWRYWVGTCSVLVLGILFYFLLVAFLLGILVGYQGARDA